MTLLRKSTSFAMLALAVAFGQLRTAHAQDNPPAQGDTSPKSAQEPDKTPTAQAIAAPLPDSTKLEILVAKKADYPMKARERQIQGEVIIRVVVSEAGTVDKAEVVSGDPILAQAALAAAEKWTFKPFIKNGKPTKVATKLPFDFAFQGKFMEHGVSEDQSATITTGPSTPGAQPPSSSVAQGNTSGTPLRVRVSSAVTGGFLLRKVAPVYPELALRAHIEGTVILQAVIDKEGRVADLKVISGPKELVDAAIGAVQQWRYRPYLLNGQPVEVETQIQVNFGARRF